MAARIEDYGLIGNLNTAALCSKFGSIDWFCPPRFDSDACFSSLLGYDEHGRWLIRPTTTVSEYIQKYRKDTLVLETEFHCDTGSARLIEFMPLNQERCAIIRIVEGIEGVVPIEMLLDIRFEYGENNPWINPADSGFSFVSGPDGAIIRSSTALKISKRTATAYFEVKKGDRVTFQLEYYFSHLPFPAAMDPDEELKKTETNWKKWASQCTYQGEWREAVMRSMITLKALTYLPTGAIVAAPTTSLPEELGGVRNWDYRFCWIRDSSLTLEALLAGGYIKEATAFRDWILRVTAGDPSQTQIMYSIDGSRRLTEFELKTLPGYEGSKPVRIGNAASEQFQLDIFGELFNTIYMSRKRGLAPRKEAQGVFLQFLDYIGKVWQHPDDGVWEVRGGRQHFTYSKVMAWVAIDRSIRSIEELPDFAQPEIKEMLPGLKALRARIHEEVCERAFHPGVNAFTQFYGSEVMDASALMIPKVGFLPPDDPRVAKTVEAVEKYLLRDGFVLRYDTQHGIDGLPGREGAFLACSFWLVDNYACLGRMDEANALFERLLSLRNHLGLLSEEYDPVTKRQIGNFPQGFSHLSLISSAQTLSDLESKRSAA